MIVKTLRYFRALALLLYLVILGGLQVRVAATWTNSSLNTSGLLLNASNVNAHWQSTQDVNQPITDLILSNTNVQENSPIGTVVGSLSAVDEDIDQTYTFRLVNEPGYSENSAFQISGSNLVTRVALDYETKQSYLIKLGVSDGGVPPSSREKTFIIHVQNGNDAPQVRGVVGYIIITSRTLNISGIMLSDHDASTGTMELTLSDQLGNLTLNTLNGVTLPGGTNGSKTITLRGTLTALQNVMNAELKYVYTQPASDQIVITLNDLGNTGLGGPMSGSMTIDVNVIPVPRNAAGNWVVYN